MAKASEYQWCLVLIFVVGVAVVSGTLSPSSKTKNKSKAKEYKANSGPVSESVFDRGLIEEEPSSKDIITEGGTYFADTSFRNFNGTILGYVTPVNSLYYPNPEL